MQHFLERNISFLILSEIFNEDVNNILKQRYLLTESQYQKEQMNRQYSKLNYNSYYIGLNIHGIWPYF